MLPYGVPFDSLSFLYLTSGHSFDFKNLVGLSRFLTPPIFYIDGWMDGWDGMVGPLFFFGPYLENYFIIFLNFFSSLKYMFLHFFLEYSQKKIGMFFFSKNFAKIGGWFFFSTFWTQIRKFLENNLIFFSDCFGSPQKRF